MRTKSDIAARRGHNQRYLRGGVSFFKYALAALALAGIGASVPMGETRNLTRNLTEDEVTQAIFATLLNSTETVDIDTAPPHHSTNAPPRATKKKAKGATKTKKTKKKKAKKGPPKTKAEENADARKLEASIEKANELLIAIDTKAIILRANATEPGYLETIFNYVVGSDGSHLKTQWTTWVNKTMENFNKLVIDNEILFKKISGHPRLHGIRDNTTYHFNVKVLGAFQDRMVERFSAVKMAHSLLEDPAFADQVDALKRNSSIPLKQRLADLRTAVDDNNEKMSGINTNMIIDVMTANNPVIKNFTLFMEGEITRATHMVKPDARARKSVDDYASWILIKYAKRFKDYTEDPGRFGMDLNPRKVWVDVMQEIMNAYKEYPNYKELAQVLQLDRDLAKKLFPKLDGTILKQNPMNLGNFSYVNKSVAEMFTTNTGIPHDFLEAIELIKSMILKPGDFGGIHKDSFTTSATRMKDDELREKHALLREANAERKVIDKLVQLYEETRNQGFLLAMGACVVIALGHFKTLVKLPSGSGRGSRRDTHAALEAPFHGNGSGNFWTGYAGKITSTGAIDLKIGMMWFFKKMTVEFVDGNPSPLEVYQEGWAQLAAKNYKVGKREDVYYYPLVSGICQKWKIRPRAGDTEGNKRVQQADLMKITLEALHREYCAFKGEDLPEEDHIFNFNDYYEYNGPAPDTENDTSDSENSI